MESKKVFFVAQMFVWLTNFPVLSSEVVVCKRCLEFCPWSFGEMIQFDLLTFSWESKVPPHSYPPKKQGPNKALLREANG